jgi:replication factor C subunit 1
MYTVKYRPNKLEDFVGNKNIIQPFIRWLLEWDANNKKTKCALISGLNGVGKTLLVELILKKHDYNIINLSIDDDRDKETITQIIKPLLKTKRTFDGQENCLVVSDIDCASGDYGFISILTECIKETQIPIICICDDRYSQNIKPILNYCFDIKLSKPSYDDIYRLIYKVVTTENLKISKQGVDKLYEQANGDIRFILNSLQMGLKKGDSGKNIQSSNIFDTTGKLFSKETSIDEKLRFYWMAHDIHTLMVQENYINNTLMTNDDVKRLENICYSADSLSDADLFDSVFDFELSTYVALNTIKSTIKCNKKGMIKFPQFLGKVATINKNKREKMNYEDVNLMGDKPKITKATTSKSKEEKAPKVKGESKVKRETKAKAKK